MDRRKHRALAGLVAGTLFLGGMGASRRAEADARDQSRAAFLRGVAEAHQEHFTAARDAFLEAYRLFPHPSILMNLGIARLRTGEYVAAEEDLARFLSDDGGASLDDIANARSALAAARRHLGTLRIRVGPEAAHATLDGVAVPLVPSAFTDVRAVVGPAELRVEAPGLAPVVRQLLIARDQPVLVDLTLLPPGAGPVPPAPGTAAEPGTKEPVPPGAETPAPRPLLPYVLFGGAGVAAVVGTIAGFEAIGLAHDYNTPGSGSYQNASTRSRGIVWRTSSDVFFATAIALGGAGAYFYFVAPARSGPALKAGIGPGSLTLSGAF